MLMALQAHLQEQEEKHLHVAGCLSVVQSGHDMGFGVEGSGLEGGPERGTESAR
jgi:hypothetical protein